MVSFTENEKKLELRVEHLEKEMKAIRHELEKRQKTEVELEEAARRGFYGSKPCGGE